MSISRQTFPPLPKSQRGAVVSILTGTEVFLGEPHLAINCIALSPSRDRYLYTHVDEAWCIDRHGTRLWGVRMPERPVETYHHTFEVGGMGGHTGTAAEIEEALKELELALPVTPDEIRQKYRGLVRQLHPTSTRATKLG